MVMFLLGRDGTSDSKLKDSLRFDCFIVFIRMMSSLSDILLNEF
jgi:hypothetical protein